MTKKRGVSDLPKTYHEGANDERTAMLAKVRRLIKLSPLFSIWRVKLVDLERWLLSRNERYNKRKGGL